MNVIISLFFLYEVSVIDLHLLGFLCLLCLLGAGAVSYFICIFVICVATWTIFLYFFWLLDMIFHHPVSLEMQIPGLWRAKKGKKSQNFVVFCSMCCNLGRINLLFLAFDTSFSSSSGAGNTISRPLERKEKHKLPKFF